VLIRLESGDRQSEIPLKAFLVSGRALGWCLFYGVSER